MKEFVSTSLALSHSQVLWFLRLKGHTIEWKRKWVKEWERERERNRERRREKEYTVIGRKNESIRGALMSIIHFRRQVFYDLLSLSLSLSCVTQLQEDSSPQLPHSSYLFLSSLSSDPPHHLLPFLNLLNLLFFLAILSVHDSCENLSFSGPRNFWKGKRMKEK